MCVCMYGNLLGEELHKTPAEALLHSFCFGRLGVGPGMCMSGEAAGAASSSEPALKDDSGVFC